MNKPGFFCLAAALLLSACASPPKNGQATHEWLDLQKSGNAASSETPMLSGEAADKVYKRYVDSFGRPLPESFSRESFSSGSGGSSGGGEQK